MKSSAKQKFGLILICCGLVSCFVGLWLLLQPSHYRATTRIKVEPDASHGLSGPRSLSGYDPYIIQPELEFIQSETLLGKVVESLDLNPEWGRKYASGRELKHPEKIRMLKRRMNVRHVRNTSFIEMQVTTEDPAEAARIANAVAEVYRDRKELPKTSMVEILDRATPPAEPSGPNRFLGAGLLTLGIFLGASGLFILRTVRRTVVVEAI